MPIAVESESRPQRDPSKPVDLFEKEPPQGQFRRHATYIATHQVWRRLLDTIGPRCEDVAFSYMSCEELCQNCVAIIVHKSRMYCECVPFCHMNHVLTWSF